VYLANKTQKLAARILESHMARRRVSHAYIFSGSGEALEMAELAGERGSADIKEEFAVAFAAALLSGSEKLFQVAESSISARIWKRNHPDVRWIGEDQEERSIKVGEDSSERGTIREIIHWAGIKPYESPWKLCIVLKSERLTDVAANAFLKTLEEPPPHTVFLLLVENKTHLLETIQSRCFEIRIPASESFAVPRSLAGLATIPVKEILESYPSLSKEDLRRKLDGLMPFIREKITNLVSADSPDLDRWLEAMDLVYDSKAALGDNVNYKLMLTRLAMRLSRILPVDGKGLI